MFNEGAGVEGAAATASARGAQSPSLARERAVAAVDPVVVAEGAVNAEENTVVEVEVDTESKEVSSLFLSSASSTFPATKHCFIFK